MKGCKMGRQVLTSNKDIGRTIIALTQEMLDAIDGKLTVKGCDSDGIEFELTLDCAYTYFYDGKEKITADQQECAAFLIIDEKDVGRTIDGYGYYRFYSNGKFLFDTLGVPKQG